ncbi:MAG: hypothetical protein VCB25_01535 [Myxococcota bacterium]
MADILGFMARHEFRLDVCMKRRFWLSLTVTVLFGIGAPLCALACVDVTAGSEVVAQADRNSGSPAPCHGSSSSQSPAEAPESHQDCGCDFSIDGLLPDAASAAAFSVVGWTHSQPVAEIVVASKRAAMNRHFEPDMPVPDILLRKSTLLI